MATIKEMAHDHRVMVANSDDYYAPEDSFEAGANAVLDEIVAMLPKTDKNLNDYGKALVWRLTEKIKELKS